MAPSVTSDLVSRIQHPIDVLALHRASKEAHVIPVNEEGSLDVALVEKVQQLAGEVLRRAVVEGQSYNAGAAARRDLDAVGQGPEELAATGLSRLLGN